MVYKERRTCRGCGSEGLQHILDLGNQHLINFIAPDASRAALPRAPLVWCRCDRCNLLQLGHEVEQDAMWREYWYRSGVNATMGRALSDVVQDGLQYHAHGVWLDIGANDGTLLSKVPSKFHKIGVEPALNVAPLCEEHADLVIADYFSAEHVEHRSCDVVTSCAMFYDLNDPGRFIEDVVKVLKPDGVWINQLSDTPTMMRQNAFDNICHEHACYYDVRGLAALYHRHGLEIESVKFNEINGGSMRVAARRMDVGVPFSLSGIPSTTVDEIERFANRVRRWKYLMGEMLEKMVRNEALWLYGASTKAAVALQYLNMNERFIACADRNPTKYGKVMAGTWIPITDEATMRREPPPYVLVGPWAFKKEFVEREAELRARGTTFIFPLPNPELVL